MKVQRVPIEWVPRTWPTIAPFVANALHLSRAEYTVEHAQAYAATGQWLVFVASEGDVIYGAATVEVFNRPASRVAFVTALGGRRLMSADAVQQFKQALGVLGVTQIEGAVRPSMARLLARYGLTNKYSVVGVTL